MRLRRDFIVSSTVFRKLIVSLLTGQHRRPGLDLARQARDVHGLRSVHDDHVNRFLLQHPLQSRAIANNGDLVTGSPEGLVEALLAHAGEVTLGRGVEHQTSGYTAA